MLGVPSGRGGTGHPLVSPTSVWGGYATADGGLTLGGINGERFAKLCQIMGVPELAERPALTGRESRWTQMAELNGGQHRQKAQTAGSASRDNSLARPM